MSEAVEQPRRPTVRDGVPPAAPADAVACAAGRSSRRRWPSRSSRRTATSATGWLLSAIGASIPIGIAYGWFSWRNTHYRIGDDDLRLETGVLRKRSRRVRLDRLQAVDVVRPLVARALGLAELRLEVAGGGVVGGAARLPVRGRRPAAARRAARPRRRPAPRHPRGPRGGAARGAAGPAGRGAPCGRSALIGMLVSLRLPGRRHRGHRRVVAAGLRGAVRPGGRARLGRRRGAALRLHGGRVARRPPAAARPARDPVADRAAGPGAGGAGGRAAGCGARRGGAGSRSTSPGTSVKGRPLRRCSARWPRGPRRWPCSPGCCRGSTSTRCR